MVRLGGVPDGRGQLALLLVAGLITSSLVIGSTAAAEGLEVTNHEDIRIEFAFTSLGAVVVDSPQDWDCETPRTPRTYQDGGVRYNVRCQAPTPGTCTDPTTRIQTAAHPRWGNTDGALTVEATCLPDGPTSVCGWFDHPHGLAHAHAAGRLCEDTNDATSEDVTAFRCRLTTFSVTPITSLGGQAVCSAGFLANAD